MPIWEGTVEPELSAKPKSIKPEVGFINVPGKIVVCPAFYVKRTSFPG